jgi:hypothetical protein
MPHAAAAPPLPPLLLLLLLLAPAAAAETPPSSLSASCAALERVLFVDVRVAAGGGAVARPAPYRAEVGLTLANTGVAAVSLAGVRVGVSFSRRVRDPSGAWAPAPAPPAAFLLSCWTLEHVSAAGVPDGALSCAAVANATLTDTGVELVFSSAPSAAPSLLLCAGCGLRGGGGDAALVLQHKDFAALDRDAMAPLQVTCGGSAVDVMTQARAMRDALSRCVLFSSSLLFAPGRQCADAVRLRAPARAQLEEPDRGALPAAQARAHPACAPHYAAADAGAPLACAPAAALAALSVAVATAFVLPSAAAATAAAAAATPPVEILLRPRLRNGGAAPLQLLGVRVPLAFQRRVRVPTPTPRWAAAGGDEWVADCWGGAVTGPDGERVSGDRSPCEYASLQATDGQDGMELVFVGGVLCAGCTLAGGGADGTMFSLKHESNLPMDAPPAALQPAGAAACDDAQLPPPPRFCGLRNDDDASTAVQQQQQAARSVCPSAEELLVSVTALPFPSAPEHTLVNAAASPDDWFMRNTELRLVLNVTNAGSRPLPLRALRLSLSYDYTVFAGPTVGWLRRPPSEFSFSCWFGAAVGPSVDGEDACGYSSVRPDTPPGAELTYGAEGDDGAAARVSVSFSRGWLCPGCSLTGGAGGILGVWHHIFFMPQRPSALQLRAVTCDDDDGGGGGGDDAAGVPQPDDAPAAQVEPAAASPPPPAALSPPPPKQPSPPPPLSPRPLAVQFTPLNPAAVGAADPSAFGAAAAASALQPPPRLPTLLQRTAAQLQQQAAHAAQAAQAAQAWQQQSQARIVDVMQVATATTPRTGPDGIQTPPPPATPPKACPWWRPINC